MAKKYKKNKNQVVNKKKVAERDINKISVPNAKANRDMIACAALKRMVKEIQDAKKQGKQSTYILGFGNSVLVPREAIEIIHEAGYDLRFTYWEHNEEWTIIADWQPEHNGALLMRENCNFTWFDRETTLDEIYSMDLKNRNVKIEDIDEPNSKKNSKYDINSIKVPLASDDRDVIACAALKRMIDVIKQAKEYGNQTAHLCPSEKLPPREAIEKIHESGYDLAFQHFRRDRTWWITASWQIGCRGTVKMDVGGLEDQCVLDVTLDDIYEKDLVYRGKMSRQAEESETVDSSSACS